MNAVNEPAGESKDSQRQPTDDKLTEQEKVIIDANYVIFTAAIVVLTIVNSILIVSLRRATELHNALLIINQCLSVFLLADAFWRIRHMRNRISFLFHDGGWLIFVGSLPIPFFALARVLHSSRALGRFRRAEFSEARNVIVTKRAQSTLLFVVLTAIIVYEIAVLLVIAVEVRHPGSNIVTANDALWWGYVTIATVGYGDYFPVTAPGRIVGVALMTVGVGLFSGITSFMADWFRRPRNERGAAAPIIRTHVDAQDPLSMLADMRATIAAQEKASQAAISELQVKLEELETTLRLQMDMSTSRTKHPDGTST